jgi:hypothetical protein
MPNEPIRRDLFEAVQKGVDYRLGRLEEEVRALREQHETDMDELAKRDESRRQWTWQKVTGVVAAAGALAGLWVQALSR